MLRTVRRFIYLLQLENYDLGRFWRVVTKKPFSRQKARQDLVWTPKLAAVFVLSILLQILTAYLILLPLARSDIYLGLFPLVFAFLFLLFLFVNFVFLSLAVLILKPADYLIKYFVVSQGKSKIEQMPKLKVIAITGSYGKTTMKEVLATILSERFTVLKTPESVNTPVGISRLILKQLNLSVEVFIAEMGAYHTGDIKALCEIARPDIAILTGINEAHLERFGGIENTIKAKFEIVENAKKDALIVLNNDDRLVHEHYKYFIGARGVQFYKATERLLEYPAVPVLGEYIWAVINACVIIARQFGMKDQEILAGIAKIQPVPHRLQKIENPNGITVIDDSYNGNPDGVREAIKVLSRFDGRRKVYITPGLVEAGEKAKALHNAIGKQLNGVADLLILVKNSVTPFIAEELDQHKVIWFDSALEAHAALPNILQKGDVILFQNDWPDNYL